MNPDDLTGPRKKRSHISYFRSRTHKIIFEADTRIGKWFDVLLILSILLSILTVMLNSLHTIPQNYGQPLHIAEWVFTILFTIEYLLRLWSVEKLRDYAMSFYGWVDLLAIIPTYVSLFLPGSEYLLVIRMLRILRVFRILKLVQYVSEANTLLRSLYASRRKILVFLYTVWILVTIIGSLMYLVEGEKSGFTSIPRSIYWAIVTLTTVGYGDIAPQTNVGQALASVVMILGYSIIAVPTGIITAELTRNAKQMVSAQTCQECSREEHNADARFCKYCGTQLSQ